MIRAGLDGLFKIGLELLLRRAGGVVSFSLDLFILGRQALRG